MREIYLDYYSKSLQPENDHNKWAYSKRLNEEAKDHEMKLQRIFKENRVMKEYSVPPI